MKKYTSDDIDSIIALYSEGLSQRQVAKQVGCSPSFVKTTLRDHNVPQRTKAFYAKSFDDKTEEMIINDYQCGLSIRDLAKKYNSSTMPIVSLFKRHNLEFRDLSHSIRVYDINEDYFNEVDTPNKAYILGFLLADGANTSDYAHGHYLITLTIHPKDEHILEEIRKEMSMESGIFGVYREKTDTTYVQIRICNKQLVLRLHELGIVPCKSFITTFPHWLSDDLTPHFLRGLFDGDGSISTALDYANIVGSDSLIYDVAKLIEEKFDFTPHIYPHAISKGISFMVISRKNDKLKFLDWIYHDADLKLQRKYNLYQKLVSKYAS